MNIKQKLLAIAIAFVFVFFIGYGIEVFHDAPERDTFCNPEIYSQTSEESCTKVGGVWQENPKQLRVEAERSGFCSEPRSCQDNYRNAQEGHDRIVFIVALIISILTFVGATQIKVEAVSSGLMGGAILLLLYGTVRYWQHTNDVIKFTLLGVALAALVYLGYKKLK